MNTNFKSVKSLSSVLKTINHRALRDHKAGLLIIDIINVICEMSVIHGRITLGIVVYTGFAVMAQCSMNVKPDPDFSSEERPNYSI